MKSETTKGIVVFLTIKKALSGSIPVKGLELYKGDPTDKALEFCYDHDVILPLRKDENMSCLVNKLSEIVSKLADKNLKKGKDLDTTPPVPKAGSNVGGSNGISKKGIHDPKTANTDMPGHDPRSELKSPDLKQSPQSKNMLKLPKLPKLAMAEQLKLSLTKADYEKGSCEDCYQKVKNCKCFNSLSKPGIQMNKNEVKMTFQSDWDKDMVQALLKSIKRGRNV